MAKERVLITVKTYPTLSRKYGETVCTAGVREDGSWGRVYPVPFRRVGGKGEYCQVDLVGGGFIKKSPCPRPGNPHPAEMEEVYPRGLQGDEQPGARGG